jgi:hypothetical protein
MDILIFEMFGDIIPLVFILDISLKPAAVVAEVANSL